MDFQRFRTQLDELSQFFAYIEQRFTPEDLSELDRDTLMTYVRDLYKSFFVASISAPISEITTQQLPKTNDEPTKNVETVVEKPIETVIETVFETVEKHNDTKEIPLEIVETIEDIQPIIVVENIDQKIAEITTEVETEKVQVLLPEIIEQPQVQETGMVILANTDLQTQEVYKPEIILNTIVDDEMFEQHEVRFNPEYDDFFYIKDTKELSQKLADARIEDLNKAMGLNDKFLYINELFGGNAARFKIAIDFFNQEAKSLNDARAYIERELIENFKWTTPLKTDLSKQFIKLLRRRYLK